MKFIRLDLLTLLISLFILSSCKNQNDIGLPVGDQQLNGTLLVYDDINVKTAKEDSALTGGLSKTPLADFNDSRFGTTKADIATTLQLPSDVAYTVPTGTITTDSVILELVYNSGFYGDSLSSKYKINVYQLTNRPLSSENYYNTRTFAYNSTNLVNPAKAGPYNVRPNTSVRVTDIATGKADTIASKAPHLRISLQPSLFTTNLFNNTAAIGSSTAFQNAIKGLYLTVERSQSSQVGGAIMFNLASSSVKVYYRADNAGTIDTGVAPLNLTTYSAAVKHTYSTEINTALSSTSATADAFYVKGLAGLRTKVSFPNVKTMFGNVDLKTIAITRAELVISPEPGTDLPPFVALPQLTLYRYDITGQRQQLPDANGTTSSSSDPRFLGVGAFGGGYKSTSKDYHFLVTGYLQDLVSGKTQDYGTYIGAVDTLSSSTTAMPYAATVQTGGRLIATGSKKTSNTRIKLNVIYTKNN